MRTGHCHIGDAKSRTESPPIWTDRRLPKLRGDGRSRLRPAIAQRLGDVQPSHGRSVEIGESASHSQRAPRTTASKIAALVTEKFQCGEDSRLTDDQHHTHLRKSILSAFIAANSSPLSPPVALNSPLKRSLVAETANRSWSQLLHATPDRGHRPWHGPAVRRSPPLSADRCRRVYRTSSSSLEDLETRPKRPTPPSSAAAAAGGSSGPRRCAGAARRPSRRGRPACAPPAGCDARRGPTGRAARPRA